MKTICESKRKMIKSVIFGLVFAVFVECFLVNYRTWESFTFSPIEGCIPYCRDFCTLDAGMGSVSDAAFI